MAPVGTPPEIVTRLRKESAQVQWVQSVGDRAGRCRVGPALPPTSRNESGRNPASIRKLISRKIDLDDSWKLMPSDYLTPICKLFVRVALVQCHGMVASVGPSDRTAVFSVTTGAKPDVIEHRRSTVSDRVNRRRFLRAGAAVASIAAISQPWLGSVALADYAVAPVKRRAASGLAANHRILIGYARAIAAMKALPATNPCSWAARAAIHFPGLGPAGPCDHGTMFWSWHRMYLYWFERIIRHKSGMYDWSLPYWDYDWEAPNPVSPATQRQIPAPFRVTTSQLYDGTRNSGLNGGGSLSSATTATAAGFTPTSYMTAQSSFQGTPHNVVHGAVGGNMGGFPTAGLDPLFWLHHCEIDRLWNLWLAKGGGRSSPLSDTTWKNTKFTFYDECCEKVEMTGCEVLRAAQQLSYVYQVEPAQVRQACLNIAFPWVFPELIRTIKLAQPLVLDKDTRVVPLVGVEDRAFASRLASLAKSSTETVILHLKDVEADSQPGAMWEVYVGLPQNAKPDATSPYFVGNVAMFGDGIKGEGHHPAEFTFPLNRALRARAAGSSLQVTFVPTSGVVVGGRAQPADVKAPVRIGEVNLLLDKAQPKPQ